MGISFTERIHIAPQGYEDERIYQPTIDNKADRLILLPHRNADDRSNRCKNNIQEAISDTNIQIEVVEINIFDMGEAIEQFLKLIRRNQPNNDLKLNASSGSKITAISGMMACMFTDADPYYVIPEGYGDNGDGTVSYGVEKTIALPAYPVTEPDYELIQVLDYIQENQQGNDVKGVLLKSIGEFLLESDLPAVAGSDKEPEQAEDIYNIINTRIIEPLERRGLIRKTRFQGGAHIQTTSDGDEMLELGRSFIQGRNIEN